MTVPLGEIRSDDDNLLLVLGGYGNAASPAGNTIGGFWQNEGWYDDVSDGPVTASITLRSDGSTPAVEGAWVIVAPPKFAPHQDSVITLYDRVLQRMIDGGLATAPTTTSVHRRHLPDPAAGPRHALGGRNLRRPHLGRPGHQPAGRRRDRQPAPAHR